ncbi:hypothetical protein FBQ82_08980 [Anaerolineae bacterium CFX7]|nr:hypothetical protein [Anaerolineae bacterium CFX7]
MNTTLAQNKTISLGWLAAFAIASAIGIVVTMAGVLPLLWTYSESVGRALGQFPSQIVGGVIFGLGLGTAVGIAQSLVLRGRERDATRWLVGSIIGGVVAGVVGILISIFNDEGENVPVMILAFATLGAILGLGQFLAARSIARSPLWIAANAVGLVAAWFIASTEAAQPVSVFVGALVFGIVTAAALWWFSRQ